MEFMLLIVNRKGAPAGDPAGMVEMEKFAADLAQKQRLKGGAPLHPEASGARVRVRDGKAAVLDGPFSETREVIDGWYLIEAEDRAAAIEIAKRCPHVRAGVVEVRSLPDRHVARAGEGPKFLMLMMMDPGLIDQDRSKLREMVAYDEVLTREGLYLESAELGPRPVRTASGTMIDPPAVRVEVRSGRILVTDGPFAETKEIVGGYYVIEAASRAQAIGLAKRCPHAKWGTVEVREARRP